MKQTAKNSTLINSNIYSRRYFLYFKFDSRSRRQRIAFLSTLTFIQGCIRCRWLQPTDRKATMKTVRKKAFFKVKKLPSDETKFVLKKVVT